MDSKINEIVSAVRSSNRIALFTHINCDCDGIGSMLAIYEFLSQSGKNVEMFCDDTQGKFSFLKNYEKIKFLAESEEPNGFEKFDLLIALDTSTILRLGRFSEAFTLSRRTINIDHHKSNSNFAQINYVKPYSSCGEVVFEIFDAEKLEFNKTTATCLFSAISSDTNSFTNPDVTARTFVFAGKLVEKGADFNLANIMLHKHKTAKNLKLISYMTKKVQVKNGVSSLVLKQKAIKKLKADHGDVAKFLNLVCDVEGAGITFIAKESEKGSYRVSLRSVANFDVNKIASFFGGGGHKNASGCTLCKKQIKFLRELCENEVKKEN